MDTQTTVTYQITDPLTNEHFFVNELYQAKYYYENEHNVTEIHKIVTRLSPFYYTELHVVSHWTDEGSNEDTPIYEA